MFKKERLRAPGEIYLLCSSEKSLLASAAHFLLFSRGCSYRAGYGASKRIRFDSGVEISCLYSVPVNKPCFILLESLFMIGGKCSLLRRHYSVLFVYQGILYCTGFSIAMRRVLASCILLNLRTSPALLFVLVLVLVRGQE